MKVEELFFESSGGYYQTFDGRIKKMYEKARTRTGVKGHKGTMISPQEFFDFASKDKTYKKLFKEWEKSGFDLLLTPTLDRVDVNKGYTSKNLQFLTYRQNVIKGNKEWNKQPGIYRRMKITATKGSKKKTFNSMTEVAKFFNVHPATVTRAVQNEVELSGWKLSKISD